MSFRSRSRTKAPGRSVRGLTLRFLVALLVLCPLVLTPVASAAPPTPVVLTPITTVFNNPIGIDYHQPSGKVVVSVNYFSGLPYNFELIAFDGTHSQFSAVSGLSDEVKIASVRASSCQGGFLPGELFTGTGASGVIARISPTGATIQNPWVTLPGEFGLMRGSLFQDRYCAANGDLVVVTTAGNVWRVTSAGVPTFLVALATHLEGVTTVPNNPAKYGPWAGKILAGAENQGRIYAIDPVTGIASFYTLGINPEDFDIVPANENFFGVNYPIAIQGASASQWADKVGDMIVTQEFPGTIFDVRWNGTTFEVTPLATVSQWEHVTFAPSGIVEIPPADATKPACAITKSILGPPKAIEITAQDTGTGLASITVKSSSNVTVTGNTGFTVGTTAAVVVTATKINQSLSSSVTLSVKDVAGNETICDPLLTVVIREAGKPEAETYTGLPQAESKVAITNGTPGVRNLELNVNGTVFKVNGLKDGATTDLDISSAMHAGNDNTVTITARGKPGASAFVVISD